MEAKVIEHIIIIGGPIASGKSTLAKKLSETFHIPTGSFSGYLRSYCETHHIDISRQSLQDLGQRMLQNDPVAFLKAVVQNQYSETSKMILEGVRHTEILEALPHVAQKHFSVFIKASTDELNQRIKQRLGASSSEFDHPVESEVNKLAYLCDYIYDGSEDSFALLLKKLNWFLSDK